MDKYYTPDIKEFHVGFRFELLEDGVWANKVLQPGFGGYDDTIDLVEAYLKGGKIRVKYLDGADIKALGWKEVKGLKDVYEQKSKRVPHTLVFQQKGSYVSINVDASDYVFDGICKNYNELHKLMEMIGFKIIDNG